MRHVKLDEIDSEREFALIAAEHFKNNPNHNSFGELKEGEFLALRGGLIPDSVIVLKICEYTEPTNYTNIIIGGEKDE